MRLGEVSKFSNFPALPYFLSLSYDHEDVITKLRPRLTGKLKPIMDFMNIADSPKFCSEFIADDSTCSTIYGGVMEIGYKGTMVAFLTYMKKLHSVFSILPKASRTYVGLSQFTNRYLVMIGDIRNKYEAAAFEKIFYTLYHIEEDWETTMKTMLNLKFSSYLILFFVLFFVLWKKMTNNMKYDIMKALGIINILPTIHLRANSNFLISISQSSLIH